MNREVGALGVERRFGLFSLILIVFVLFLGVVVTPSWAQAPRVTADCGGASHVSILLEGGVNPGDSETSWSFAYSTAKGGPWTPVPGAQGTITELEVEELNELSSTVHSELIGVMPETVYYVLLTAKNASGTVSEEARNFNRGIAGCESIPLRATPFIRDVNNVTAISAHVSGSVNPNANASEIHWDYEYATTESGPWIAAPGAEGTISKAEAEATPAGGPFPSAEADLSGLKPGAVYYVRLLAEDEPEPSVHKQATSAASRFETSGPPTVQTFAVHALHGEAMRLLGAVRPNNNGLDEIQTVTIGDTPADGTFTLTLPGQTTAATGTGDLTSGSTTVLGVLTSTGVFLVGEPLTGVGIPAGTAIAGVDPGNNKLILSQAATVSGTAIALTAGLPRLPFNATREEVRSALEKLSSVGDGNIVVSGSAGGPYTVEFTKERGSFNQPLLAADASDLTPSGTVTVAAIREGFSYDTHYHFEYVSTEQFEVSGWAQATTTTDHSIVDTNAVIGGEDITELRSGETYRYRIVATNTTPGNPVVDGADQALTVPSVSEPSSGEGGVECLNQQFRIGLSAGLPDCRAYEQVTPVNKEGAQEVFHYGPTSEGSGALIGEDGEHVMIGSPETKFGTGPGAGQSPYFFTRMFSGWSMTAASTQPETGVNRTDKQVIFDPDLTKFGFATFWQTSPSSESPNSELKVGPPGGPYTAVVSVAHKRAGQGWVAASEDFSSLIFQVEDHALLGHSTGSVSGEDIYEYSEGGLRQVNVLAQGATIGVCGARIAKGEGEPRHAASGGASRHAVSADGSRVFFEAVPGNDCSAETHLYMREVSTDRTLDIGAYMFVAANTSGTELLIEKRSGDTRKFFRYETVADTVTPVFSGTQESEVSVSEDFTAIYFTASGSLAPEAPLASGFGVADLYRYDVPTGTLHFLVQADFGQANGHGGPSPDGRYYYFAANSVPGVPGGASGAAQVYRYDNAQNVVQCMSCASPFDPEPRLAANYAGFGLSAGIFGNGAQGMPEASSFSPNGDYAFFDTPAALVPQDVDSEVAPTPASGEYISYSPSSDVYEWRREGLNGCTHIQGCLSLISSGMGGYKVLLLGTAHEGRDVFFGDFSQLLPRDNDTAGDIYDARIDGGYPEPMSTVECEGDTCSTPASPPNDATPSSFTFTGPGNLIQGTAPLVKPKKIAKPSKCTSRNKRTQRKCVKTKTKAKKLSKPKRKISKPKTNRLSK